MDELYVSKTARKREAHELQELGQTLAALKRVQLDTLPLPDKLAQALFDYQRFTTHEARRRQMQFIGRLMRGLDTTPIIEALATLRGESADARYRQHEAEHWRDRLLAEPETLTEFIETYPECDRQTVRQALTRARKPAGEVETRTALRALFRVLRDQIPDA